MVVVLNIVQFAGFKVSIGLHQDFSSKNATIALFWCGIGAL